MKRLTFTFTALLFSALLTAQNPQFGPINAPSTCGEFEKYELVIDHITDLPEHPNFPSVPQGYFYYSSLHIALYAVFTSPSGKKYNINGFYNEDYDHDPSMECAYLQGPGVPQVATAYHEEPSIDTKTPVKQDWRIRFAPNETGSWMVEVFAQLGYAGSNFPPGVIIIDAATQHFECVAGPLSDRGYIKIGANQRPIRRDGSNLPLIGEHIENDARIQTPVAPDWNLNTSAPTGKIGGICMFRDKINELTQNGGNYFRMSISGNLSHKFDINGNLQNYPFRMGMLIYYNTGNYNNLGFDIKNAYRYDKVLEYASDQDVFIRPVLFTGGMLDPDGWEYWHKPTEDPAFKPVNPYYNPHPSASACDFFSPSSSLNEKNREYLRYVIARWGYATNIVAWELIDEFDIVKDKPRSTNLCMDIGSPSIIVEWMQTFSKLIKEQDYRRHLVTAGGTAHDYPQNIPVLTQIYNMRDIDFVDNNREPTPPGKGIYTNTRRWDFNNICDPANFPTVSTSGGPRQAFEINYGWFMDYPQAQIDIWTKPFVYNSYWYTLTEYQPCLSHTGTPYQNDKDVFFTHELVDPQHFLMHDAFYATFFGNSIIAGNYYYSNELHSGFQKARAEAQCPYYNYYDIGWYDGSLVSFKETRAVMDVLLSNFDQKMISRSSHFDPVGERSFCSRHSTPGFMDTEIMVGSLHNKGKTLQKGWIKHLKYGMFTEFHNSCEYLQTLNNAPAQNDLFLAIPRAGTNVRYELKLYTFTPDYSSYTISIIQEATPSGFGVRADYAYFEIPHFVNKYGDYIYEAEAISGELYCNHNIDRTTAGDLDGDGKDEVILINKCVQVGSTFMQFYDVHSLSIEGSIMHNFDKYREFLDENDRVYIDDFILERQGEEILLVNDKVSSTNKGENFFVVINPDNGEIVRSMIVEEMLDIFGHSTLDLTTNVGNVDNDGFLELVVLGRQSTSLSFIDIESGIFDAFIPNISVEFLQNEDRMLVGRYHNGISRDYVYLLNYNTAPNANAVAVIGWEEFVYMGKTYENLLSHGPTGSNFSGWMDPCDRVLLGNVDNFNQYLYGNFNELVFVNTDNGGATGQYMVRWHDIKNNRVGPGIEITGPNADKLHANDGFFLMDIDGNNIKYLVSVNRNYATNSSGISTYNLNTGGFYSTGLFNSYSYPTGPSGNPHDGWLDNSDDHLVLKYTYNLGPFLTTSLPREAFVSVNRPHTNQYFIRPYDLATATWGQNMVQPTMHYNQCPASVSQMVQGTAIRTCYNGMPGEELIVPQDDLDKYSKPDAERIRAEHEGQNAESSIISDLVTDNLIKAYPNPTSGELNFDLRLVKDNTVSIKIYNSIGQLAGEVGGYCRTGPNKITFNGENLAPGVYSCTINIGNDVKTIRVVFTR